MQDYLQPVPRYNKVLSMKQYFTKYIKTLSILLTLVTLCTGALVFQRYSAEIIAWIHELGWCAPILFLVVYTIATILFLPTMVLTLAGGAIFGPVIGTVLNLFGATLGAASAFLITRHLVFDWFSQKRSKKLKQLIIGVDKRGWIFVALLRLFPIVPFNLVNYGLGITGIKFRLYIVCTFIFLIPAEIIYTYFGYAGMGALSNPGNFYKNCGIVFSGLAIIALCLIKFFKKIK